MPRPSYSPLFLVRKVLNLVGYIYEGWLFNSGTNFFVSERVDLPASRSYLLRSSVLVHVCTYSSVPVTDESTSSSHFL
jgi:hypothetical protein